MKGFSVTYESFTPESVEEGDASERGYVAQDVTLREALSLCEGFDHVEADCYPVTREHPPRWLTFYPSDSDPYADVHSLHLPETLTTATRLRIARLVGCYGVRHATKSAPRCSSCRTVSSRLYVPVDDVLDRDAGSASDVIVSEALCALCYHGFGSEPEGRFEGVNVDVEGCFEPVDVDAEGRLLGSPARLIVQQ